MNIRHICSLALGLLYFHSAHATFFVIGEIAEDKNGSVLQMSFANAKKYCESRNMRLPTIREFTFKANEVDPVKQVRETAFPDVSYYFDEVQDEIKKNKHEGFHAVYTAHASAGEVVDFYYNWDGYESICYTHGLDWYWTSSIHPFQNVPYAIDFCGNWGGGPTYLDPQTFTNGSVICISK